ncbi:MAG: Tad domain-containing protein [Firmicutes bacterium]|nr:Tad domain-containing protein [Bacillota bacterium]
MTLRGMVVIWAAIWALVIAGMSALVLDLGRVMAVKEQLQTTVDAGSLAASMHGVRYIKVRVPDRWKRTCGVCCGENGKCHCCDCEMTELPDKIVTGTREYVWDKEGWSQEAGCGSCGKCCSVFCGSPVVLDQWVEFSGDVNSVAKQVANLNLPADVRPGEGGGVTSLLSTIHDGKNDPLSPSVVVRFSGWIKSMLAGGLFGSDRLDLNSCGQSSVFFFKLSGDGQQTDKTNPKPEPG